MSAYIPNFESWDVIVVPFPYSERLAEKRRPALVVSGPQLHELGVMWIAMITGADKIRQRGDVVIADLANAGLPGASMVRASKIATIEPNRVLRRCGALAPGERSEISAAIAGFVGAP